MVLVTDIVSSTEARAVHGDYRANLIERELHHLISTVTGEFDGEYLRYTGDGGICLFATATEALEAATELHKRARDVATRQGADLALRAGVSIGELVRTGEDDDHQGFALLEATRLSSAATPGTTLVATTALSLVRDRSWLQIAPERAVACKGIPDPVPAHAVTAVVSGHSLPAPLEAERRTALVGRRRHEEKAEAFLEKPRDTFDSALLVVQGKPGIGKTRFMAEVAAACSRGGRAIAYASCTRNGTSFEAVIDAVQSIATAPLGDPLPPRPGPPGGAAEDQLAFFEDVAEALSSSPERAVIIVDDLQWADASTRHLLHYLLANHAGDRTLVVGCRTGFDDTLEELQRAASDSLRLDLDPLSADATRALVRSLLPPAIAADDLVGRLANDSGGSPLLAWLLAGGETRGVLLGGSAQGKGGDSLLTAVNDRLVDLSAESREALMCGAVLGEVDAPLVAAVIDAPVADVETALLSHGLRAGLIRSEGKHEFRFAHDLVSSTLADSAPPEQRVRWHMRAAEALANVGAPLARQARHLLAAEAMVAPARIVDSCVGAALAALEGRAYASAADWYALAAERASSAEEALELRAAAARAEIIAGRPAARSHALRCAEEALGEGLVSTATAALLATDRGMFSAVGFADRRFLDLATRVIDATPDPTDPATAHLRALLAAELTFSTAPDAPERRRRLSDTALRDIERTADAGTTCRVMALRAMTLRGMADIPARRRMCERLSALASQEGDAWLEFTAAMQLGAAALEDCAVELADQCVDDAWRAATELGQPRAIWLAGLMRTAKLIQQGLLDAADEARRAAEEAGMRAGFQIESRVTSIEQDLEIMRWRDQLDDRIDDLTTWAGDPSLDITFAGLRYLVDAGEVEEGARRYSMLDAGAELDTSHAIVHGPRIINLGHAALACDRADDTAHALSLLAEVPDTWFQTTVSMGCTAHHCGVFAASLRRFDEALDHFERALSHHDAGLAPLWWSETVLAAERMGVEVAAVTPAARESARRIRASLT